MTPGEIVRTFNAKKAGKGRWVAKCPAHDDRSKNTLSIKEGNRGILIHCWAGCAKEDVLAAAGLRMRDLFYTSRDTDSATLKALYRQQRIDRMYAAEVRRQDLHMVLNAIGKPHQPRTPTQFERDIEAFCARFQ